MTQNNQDPALSVEDSFNLIVNLVRQSKLTYQEHATVEKAVQVLMTELNKPKDGAK